MAAYIPIVLSSGARIHNPFAVDGLENGVVAVAGVSKWSKGFQTWSKNNRNDSGCDEHRGFDEGSNGDMLAKNWMWSHLEMHNFAI